MTSNKKLFNYKVVDRIEIWNLKLSNNLGYWYGLYESYSSQYDL